MDAARSALGTEAEIGKLDGHQKRIPAKVVRFRSAILKHGVRLERSAATRAPIVRFLILEVIASTPIVDWSHGRAEGRRLDER
jgi:hypothetical protein